MFVHSFIMNNISSPLYTQTHAHTQLCWNHVLFCSLFYPQSLTWCLEHSRCSVNNCWLKEDIFSISAPILGFLRSSHSILLYWATVSPAISSVSFPRPIPLPSRPRKMHGISLMERKGEYFRQEEQHEQGHRGQAEPGLSEVTWLRDHEDPGWRSRGGPLAHCAPSKCQVAWVAGA